MTEKRQKPLTISVPEAGRRYFGICRDSAYAAAKRGDIPTIRVGRLLRVPVRLLEALIDDAAMKRRHRAARDQVTAA